MKWLKNKTILLGAKLVMYLFMSFMLISLGYVYVVVNELKLKIAEKSVTMTTTKLLASVLEQDSKIHTSDLDNYLLFSTQGESSKYKSEIFAKNQFEKSTNKQLVLNEKIELPQVEENQCERLRCIQIKKDFSKVPAAIWKSLLGTEDFRFLEHRGVDPMAIARAIVVDIIAMKFIQGGSTLTQQLVKNLFLNSDKKLSRKLKEMVYAIYIENAMEKEEILTLYLNEVFWGTFQGVYLKGFYAASLAYFNKAPVYLTEYEATILISLLKGPNYYKPSKDIKRLKNRVNAVFKRLQKINLVSKRGKDIWSDNKWELFQADYILRSKEGSFFSYYQMSKNSETMLEPFEEIVLYNAIDRNKKRLAKRIKGADVAIKVLIADKSCDDFECENLFSYYSKIEREKRAAMTSEYHQVGSLLKPIVYDSFIELGRSYDEEISTESFTLHLKSGPWKPRDYSKAKDKTITLKKALQKSKNIPIIKVANEIGFDLVEEKLAERFPRLQKPLSEYPAQLLGALELSLEEVLQVYGRFIKDKCEHIKENELKLEDTVLFYMSVAGETTISRLARAPLKNAYVFGKTGTSNNGLDNWYFAFDGKEVYVIWFGVESERNNRDLKITGASAAFVIFQDFLNHRGKMISEILCE